MIDKRASYPSTPERNRSPRRMPFDLSVMQRVGPPRGFLSGLRFRSRRRRSLERLERSLFSLRNRRFRQPRGFGGRRRRNMPACRPLHPLPCSVYLSYCRMACLNESLFGNEELSAPDFGLEHMQEFPFQLQTKSITISVQ